MEQLTAVCTSMSRCMPAWDTRTSRTRNSGSAATCRTLPLMPGVVMLESIAQLCSYVTQRYDLLGAEIVGFGGLEDVRFRGLVLPGDRLIVMQARQGATRANDRLPVSGRGQRPDRGGRQAAGDTDSGRGIAETSRRAAAVANMGRRALRRIDPKLDLTRHLREASELPPFDQAALFDRRAPLEVEVGSGKGLFLVAASELQPGHNLRASRLAGSMRTRQPGWRLGEQTRWL